MVCPFKSVALVLVAAYLKLPTRCNHRRDWVSPMHTFGFEPKTLKPLCLILFQLRYMCNVNVPHFHGSQQIHTLCHT